MDCCSERVRSCGLLYYMLGYAATSSSSLLPTRSSNVATYRPAPVGCSRSAEMQQECSRNARDKDLDRYDTSAWGVGRGGCPQWRIRYSHTLFGPKYKNKIFIQHIFGRATD